MRPIPHLLAWMAGMAAPETQTTAAERDALARHARSCRRIVEVGVWHGVTTAILREHMHPQGTLWAVDPFPRGRFGFNAQRPIALSHVRRVRNGHVTWMRMKSLQAAAQYKAACGQSIDLVFIDGDHEYQSAAADWRAWSELVHPGGIVCLHDSQATAGRDIAGAGSVRVTHEMVLTDRRFELVDVVETLTAVRRTA